MLRGGCGCSASPGPAAVSHAAAAQVQAVQAVQATRQQPRCKLYRLYKPRGSSPGASYTGCTSHAAAAQVQAIQAVQASRQQPRYKLYRAQQRPQQQSSRAPPHPPVYPPPTCSGWTWHARAAVGPAHMGQRGFAWQRWGVPRSRNVRRWICCLLRMHNKGKLGKVLPNR